MTKSFLHVLLRCFVTTDPIWCREKIPRCVLWKTIPLIHNSHTEGSSHSGCGQTRLGVAGSLVLEVVWLQKGCCVMSLCISMCRAPIHSFISTVFFLSFFFLTAESLLWLQGQCWSQLHIGTGPLILGRARVRCLEHRYLGTTMKVFWHFPLLSDHPRCFVRNGALTKKTPILNSAPLQTELLMQINQCKSSKC